jgi:hypothetical protein
MATKKTMIKAKAVPTITKVAPMHHQLDALLHTVRCIAQYEDALCELTHEAKRSGSLTPEASRELKTILDRIPSQEYLIEVEMLRKMLALAQVVKKAISKKTVKAARRRVGKSL